MMKETLHMNMKVSIITIKHKNIKIHKCKLFKPSQYKTISFQLIGTLPKYFDLCMSDNRKKRKTIFTIFFIIINSQTIEKMPFWGRMNMITDQQKKTCIG